MKIVTVVGARPQFIKAAPVGRAIAEHNRNGDGRNVREVIVHTGQHYDHNMSQIFFDQLELRRPDYNLEIGSGTHAEMTGKMLPAIERVLVNEQPDWVLVYGDTNSTLAGALTAAKLNIPVAHIESGLRSFNRTMPEEVNRILTDHLSELLFCPTEAAVINLEKEGILRGVHNVGDVMYDAFLYNRNLADRKSTVLSEMGLTPSEYCLATVHRQENTDDEDRLRNIFDALHCIAESGKPIIVPLHPRTQKILNGMRWEKARNEQVRILPPVGYLEMLQLESNAEVILTDSGGVQKEACFARVPCITLRDETEWVETVQSGWNHIGGARCGAIMQAFERALEVNRRQDGAFYGNGDASARILKLLIGA